MPDRRPDSIAYIDEYANCESDQHTNGIADPYPAAQIAGGL
jgi:hypothetical protein